MHPSYWYRFDVGEVRQYPYQPALSSTFYRRGSLRVGERNLISVRGMVIITGCIGHFDLRRGSHYLGSGVSEGRLKKLAQSGNDMLK